MKYQIGDKVYSCPLLLTLEAISGKWKGIIIWFLLEEEVLRFSELKKKITEATKITDKMLIQCLRELEQDNLVLRKVYQVVPPKVEYSLTHSGKKMRPIFEDLIQFGLSHIVQDRAKVDEKI